MFVKKVCLSVQHNTGFWTAIWWQTPKQIKAAHFCSNHTQSMLCTIAFSVPNVIKVIILIIKIWGDLSQPISFNTLTNNRNIFTCYLSSHDTRYKKDLKQAIKLSCNILVFLDDTNNFAFISFAYLHQNSCHCLIWPVKYSMSLLKKTTMQNNALYLRVYWWSP